MSNIGTDSDAMIKETNAYELFQYDISKDKRNCIKETKLEPSFTSLQITDKEDIVNLLSVSQPQSIFDRLTRTLKCYGARSTLLKRAIALPNNYELFLAPWLADGSFSYPNNAIREDWKAWFPTGHNSKIMPYTNDIINAIAVDAFDGLTCLLDKKLKCIIKNHIDADNYWHWTFEWVPRLIIIKDLMDRNKELGSIRFINIGTPLNIFQYEWLENIFGSTIQICSYDRPVLCNNLLWVTPPFPAHHSIKTIFQIRSLVLDSGNFNKEDITNVYSQRVYVMRGNARNGRRIENEKEVINSLKSLGFKALAMDDLKVYEQASIFSNADIIIGAHGSAFVNMLFCKKSCKVIELFGPGYVSGHDYSLAVACGLQWDYLEGTSSDSVPTFSSNFNIRIDSLMRKVEKVLP